MLSHARKISSKFSEFMIIFMNHVFSIDACSFRCRIVVIKIASICRVLELRDDGTFHLAVVQGLPIDRFEECMRLDRSTTPSYVTESMSWVYSTEATDEVACIGRHGVRVADLSFNNSTWRISTLQDVHCSLVSLQFVYFHWILIPKRRLTNKKLVDKNPKSPPINRGTMPCRQLGGLEAI